MKNAFRYIKGMSRLLDIAAGAGIVITTAIIVINILLRLFFNSPLLGIYEYVGYLTASIIGLALAYCAVNKAHITIDFLMEKLPAKLRAVIDIISKSVVLIFLAILSWHVVIYGYKTALSGEVSPTVRMPFYPFIFIVAAGLIVLWFVILFDLISEAKGDVLK